MTVVLVGVHKLTAQDVQFPYLCWRALGGVRDQAGFGRFAEFCHARYIGSVALQYQGAWRQI